MTLELAQKDNLVAYVTSRDNLEILEDTLDNVQQEYLSLKKQKKNLDFGQRLTRERFEELAPEIISETEEVLGVENLPESEYRFKGPMYLIKRSLALIASSGGFSTAAGLYASRIELADPARVGIGTMLLCGSLVSVGLYELRRLYGESQYLDSQHRVTLGAINTTEAVVHISHEYTHHTQNLSVMPAYEYAPALEEGHAHGVSVIVARRLAELRDNPAINWKHLEFSAKHLRYAYRLSCGVNDLKPSESLLQAKTPDIPLEKRINPFDSNFLDRYRIGIPALLVAEARRGQGIYSDILHGDYSCFDMVSA